MDDSIENSVIPNPPVKRRRGRPRKGIVASPNCPDKKRYITDRLTKCLPRVYGNRRIPKRKPDDNSSSSSNNNDSDPVSGSSLNGESSSSEFEAITGTTTTNQLNLAKRGRGRPRKFPLKISTATPLITTTSININNNFPELFTLHRAATHDTGPRNDSSSSNKKSGKSVSGSSSHFLPNSGNSISFIVPWDGNHVMVLNRRKTTSKSVSHGVQ